MRLNQTGHGVPKVPEKAAEATGHSGLDTWIHLSQSNARCIGDLVQEKMRIGVGIW